ncbi:DUF4377 domain-containing protein [Tenacibaculum sp. C7A-26P2]|uniref:DUF4377 domain-containing protein n=1 Tax=Tenacibaculum sp. C7A-26P2 TaxID=3447504 RepID=UPI003F87EE95
MFKLLRFILFLTLTYCSSHKKIPHQIIWINSQKKTCKTLTSSKVCLEIQKSDKLDQNNWNIFYEHIEDFDYKPGYIYKLLVSTIPNKSKLNNENSNKRKYKLIQILSKIPDKKLNLNDIWILTHLNKNTTSTLSNKEKPRIEINLSLMKMIGKSSCNRFQKLIKKLTNNTLIFEKKIISTKMMCQNIKFENSFFKTLGQTNFYEIKHNQLYFFDSNKIEIARFKKID